MIRDPEYWKAVMRELDLFLEAAAQGGHATRYVELSQAWTYALWFAFPQQFPPASQKALKSKMAQRRRAKRGH